MSGPSLTVHPEHVSFSFLITALVAPPPAETGWGAGFDGPTAQRLLALFLLEELQDISSPNLLPLPQLLQRLQQQLGPAGSSLAAVLLACLQTVQTPDDIINLAARFSSFLAPAGTTAEATSNDSIAYVSTSSPMGLFLRRVRLGLSSMSLQALAGLASAVQEQVQEAVLQLQHAQGQHAEGQHSSAQPHAGNPPSHANAGNSSSASTAAALKDPAVLDAYLNTLLAAVKSLGPCLPAATVQAAAAALTDLQDSHPKLQYLDLMLSLAHKDMNAALSALHTYFDSSGKSSGAGRGPAPGSKGKGQHQAALHNLASLQAALGHPQEALAALQELLRLGQQQGDEWSLLHGLAILCRVMGVSEGLQDSSRGAGGQMGAVGSSSSSSGGGSTSSATGAWAGWGLLDLRRTEQQLQLQALLQRCLDSARDMHVPHIAAYAAVALSRFRIAHASSGSSSLDDAAAVPGLSADASSSGNASAPATTAAAAAGTSLAVQRMLLDVATLEHQAAIAAAAPHTPVAPAAGVRLEMGVQPLDGGLVPWTSELYNPTEVFGTGTSSAAPGVNVLAGAVSARSQAAGSGWRSSAATVSQALATGNVLAAAALQLQGASVLAGLRALLVLNGPGGAGIQDATIAAALSAAAAAAASGTSVLAAATATGSTAAGSAVSGGVGAAAAAVAAAAAAGRGMSAAALTGSSVHCDDVAAGWVQLVQLVLELQGVVGARHVLALAEAHFPREAPLQLAAMRQVVRLRGSLQAGNLVDARLACEELQALAPPAPQMGPELQLLAAESHVQLLHSSGSFAEAHAAAASLFATAAGAGMQPQAVAALLQMAKAALSAGDAAGGLPYALSALLHCQVLQYDGLLPEALLHVATAWQVLAPDGAAFVLALLQQVLPLAHAQGKLRVRAELEGGIARLLLALAEPGGSVSTAPAVAAGGEGGVATGTVGERSADANCIAGTAASEGAKGSQFEGVAAGGLSEGDVSEVRQRLTAAAAMLQQAGEMQGAAGCWLLLAHVCNAAGLEAGRNEAAVKWQLCKQRGSPAAGL